MDHSLVIDRVLGICYFMGVDVKLEVYYELIITHTDNTISGKSTP